MAKNKALSQEKYLGGTNIIRTNSYVYAPTRDPLSFVNSDEFRKMQNRNKKR